MPSQAAEVDVFQPSRAGTRRLGTAESNSIIAQRTSANIWFWIPLTPRPALQRLRDRHLSPKERAEKCRNSGQTITHVTAFEGQTGRVIRVC